MGMDIQMVEPPTAAEVRAAHLDADNPGYYRFNISGMSVMTTIMVAANAVAEDDREPAYPKTPPIGVAPARLEAVEEAMADAKEEAGLSKPELAFARAWKAFRRVILSQPSAHAGMVPSFKFGSNNGWLVTPPECAILATKLHAYAGALTQRTLDRLDAQYTKVQTEYFARYAKAGEVNVLQGEGLGLTLPEARKWIDEWATYNDVAAKHRGYEVF